ncbi:nicotinate phosphoribosyltransferase [Ignatzschineria indica]|nr:MULTISPECIES: nicotinate phosphoribosyltransferase [Ignatzschineria]GGZ76667.1 nicotinate phosphoribosyltransferase [Ignatzschineria indica]
MTATTIANDIKEYELKHRGKIKRLTNKTFKFDKRVGEGWFSAVYFLKTAEIARQCAPDKIVTMQFFQRKNGAVLCGIDEAISLLHAFANHPEDLEIWALNDGDRIDAYETVLTITGRYQDFGFLEGIIDGILARRTSVATHVLEVVEAAGDKEIIFMGDRDDHFSQQAGDGYAAFIGGSTAQATHAMNEWWGIEGLGTMPHALIQLFNGDTLAAAKAYHEIFPEDKLMVLVDYNNDAVEESLKVARHFGDKLSAVRVDTSNTMVDQYFMRHQDQLGTFDPRGTNPTLIFALRDALDREGFNNVKIVVSGGFNAEKIAEFEKQNTPVDIYGVGSSLLKVNISFTGDNVLLDGQEQAKAGRRYRPNPRLERVLYGDNEIR